MEISMEITKNSIVYFPVGDRLWQIVHMHKRFKQLAIMINHDYLRVLACH